MNKDNIRNLFPDASDEAVKALLDINSADITHALNKQQGAHDELTKQIATLTAQIGQKDSEIKNLTDKYTGDANALNLQHQQQLEALNVQLQEANNKAGVADALQKQVDKLTKEVAARDKTIADNSKAYRIKDGLREMKARNVDVVWPLLKLDEISEQDGQLNGLTEQVETLKQTYGYLFDSNSGDQRGGFAGSPDIGNQTDVNAAMNAALRSASRRGAN